MRRLLSASVLLVTACTIVDDERGLLDRKTASATLPTSDAGAREDPNAREGEAGAPSDVPPVSSVIIECGGKKCLGTTPYCCASANTSTCVDLTTTECTGNRLFLRCDDPTDCKTGEVCCARTIDKIMSSSCMPEAECSGVPEEFGVLCLADKDCAPGTTCTDYITDADEKRIEMKAGLCSVKQ